MVNIHKTAIVEDNVQLGENVTIGPYSIVKSNVKIGGNCEIRSHVVIDEFTTIGENCKIFHSAVLGTIPQDLKFSGEHSELIIGDNNTIREFAMINRGTKGGIGKTQIGSGNLIMAYVHIAHDCVIGNNAIIANMVQFAGHVVVEDSAVIGGMSAIHQFVKIGSLSMIGGMSGVSLDVAPFTLAVGNRARLNGLNLVGLRRNSFSLSDIEKLKEAYRIIFRSNLKFDEAYDKLKESPSKHVIDMIEFLRKSERGFCRER
ncbi:Acyl-[acyl-carrier-protein]--UDP-N- acetylglucosamine O-acyltransferase [Desulfurella amilsii]|uniref:Acyl-[acyl-carrier-protein]--UDP-N-acetylglucosamine O-acyltransferase n=1 Tax=Desulfurella amilsii TaxID=1562698 RepID=A0A1X4XVP8_9BACT|nr:acyl-ACP--UDP-N-acetylglucosamine O-acyltransferase [Desulfurella amilsii]OSS41594.1 Acyl-[acyl-carrier-protein]--UDP-N- acetylglucosamine O-acyltransferase [Desulfurella amilsii]